jgi:tetratricopeptide (TPR) repeat protein
MRRVALVLLTILVAACGGGESRKEDHLQKGQAFLAERNYAKARVEFRNALQIDPKDASARTGAGVAAERLGEFEEAAKLYRAAIAADAGQELARANLARMLLGGGAPDQALKVLAPGLEANPNSAKLLSVRAAATATSDPTAARRDADAAYAQAPQDPDVVAVLASLQWRAGQREQAFALLDQTIAAVPDALELRDMRIQLALLNGDVAAAERGLEEFIKRDPASIEQRNRLAQVYLIQGKVDPALETLRGIVALEPRSIAAKSTLIGVLAERKSRAEADRALQEFLAAEPDNYELQLEAGRYYESQQRYVEARKTYEALAAAASGRPQSARARSRLALLAIRDGDAKTAMALVDQLLAENPADGEALVTRSQLALDRGDTQTAVNDLRTALRDRPDSVPLASALARAYLQAGDATLAEQVLRDAVRANPADADAKLALAQFLVNQQRGAQATPLLEQLVAEQPTNAIAIEALFRQQMFTGDAVAAERTAGLLAALPGRRTSGRLFGGLALEGQKRFEDARKVYEQAAIDDPESVEPIVALARLDATLGKPEAAVAQVDRGLARAAQLRKDGLPLLHSLRGDLLLRLGGREQEALSAYAEAARLAPAAAAGWRGQAAALALSGDGPQAIAVLERGLTATNRAPDLVLDLATRYQLAGRNADAEKLYEQLTLAQPGNLIARNNLAMLLLADPPDTARTARALEIAAPLADARDPSLLDTWGWALHRAGRHADAVKVLGTAAGLAPQSAEIRYHLGFAQLQAGQALEGRATLAEAVRLGPDAPQATAARAAVTGK